MMPLLGMSEPSRPDWVMEGNRLSMERWFPYHDVQRVEVVDSQPFGAALLDALIPYAGEEPVTVILDDMWLDCKLPQEMVDKAYWMIEQGAQSIRWQGSHRDYRYQEGSHSRRPAKGSMYLMAMWPWMHRFSFRRDHVAICHSPCAIQRVAPTRVRSSVPQ